MTGGTVVVLGRTGRNFAAGMSGGIAYVYDEDGLFRQRCNTAMVTLESVLTDSEQALADKGALRHLGKPDEEILRELIERYLRFTGSTRALAIVDAWATSRTKFVKVFPNEYRRALGELQAKQAAMKAVAPVKQRQTA
jgi:glutamate synthase domain-containing protein 3